MENEVLVRMGKKESIRNKLQKFKNEVNVDFPVKRIIFFGSMATGKFHKDSDNEKKRQVSIVSQAIKEGIVI